MEVAVVAIPLVYVWASMWSAGLVWTLAMFSGLRAASSDVTSSTPERRQISLWKSAGEDLRWGMTKVSMWMCLYLVVTVMGLPIALQYSDGGRSISFRMHHHQPLLIVATALYLSYVAFRHRRAALKEARSGTLAYVVPRSASWSRFAALVAPKGTNTKDRRPKVEIKWLPGSLSEEDQRSNIAACYILQEDGPTAGLMGWTVALLTVISLDRSSNTSQNQLAWWLTAAELAVLLVASARHDLSLGYRLTRIPLAMRVPIHINACLSIAPAAVGTGDPLGSHRGPLDVLVSELRRLAHRAERQTRYREAVDPYPLVLRGAARTIARYLGTRELASGHLPTGLILLLRRTSVIVEGSDDGAALRQVAKNVHAYLSNGAPDPELVVRPQRWMVRWSKGLPNRLDQARTTLSAFAAIMLLFGAIALIIGHRLSAVSLPSFVK